MLTIKGQIHVFTFAPESRWGIVMRDFYSLMLLLLSLVATTNAQIQNDRDL